MYTLEDVYLFGVLVRLVAIGIRSELLNGVISSVREEPKLLNKNWKGAVSFFIEKNKGKFICWAFPGELNATDQPDLVWMLSVSKEKPLGVMIIFNPKEVLCDIDRRIAKLEKEGKLP